MTAVLWWYSEDEAELWLLENGAVPYEACGEWRQGGTECGDAPGAGVS